MNKKLYIAVLLFVSLFVYGFSQTQQDFSLEINQQTTKTFDGLTHREIIATVTKGTTQSNQVINYLSGNPKASDTLHVIVGDNYQPHNYSNSPLHTIASNLNNVYDNYEVLGGINGDYYNMNTGIPVEAYIVNGEVISTGLGFNRDVIGFKDNGEVVIGRPCFEGFEVKIYDSIGRERITLPVSRINRMPVDMTQVTVYFSNFDFDITSDLHKHVIEGTNIKMDDYDTRYFGKGTFQSATTDVIGVDAGTFVVVSENPYFKDLIEDGDTVLVQQKLACDFEDVNWAIGAWGKLVENGQALTHIATGAAANFKGPRTAVGVKPDGTVFFVTVDGRNQDLGMDGVTHYELADIMATLGAEIAYNMDGGGSTAMVTKDDDTFTYENTPSDQGGPRSLSNAIFFVKGTQQETPPKHDIPDLAKLLPAPENIKVDDSKILQWSHVPNRTEYRISINNETLNTPSRTLSLEHLRPGLYSIKVKTLGEGLFYKDSFYSESTTHIVYPETLTNIENLFKNFGRRSRPD